MCLKTDFKDGKTVRVVTVPWARLRKTRGYLSETNSCYSKSSIGGASQYGKEWQCEEVGERWECKIIKRLESKKQNLKN